ncbi:hypothetical protein DMC64_41560 [Amycolatopsis sp. WAC 04197]|uniref:hypothetical protein n=1 Tax=Amycolatopsis sp. WAC 04197 TaxID=2203199 RepID=UPI000F76F5CA|nr:hypothetical protein [Amycolatopsis sp. WAC 04197]RSN38558.1 hypothetical protein DMC64_41560 [Amycolatopsis sp. WAC 04197]
MTSSIGFGGGTRVVSTITVTPEEPTGLFRPDAMSEWVGHLVQVAGLDPAYEHTLQAVKVVPGPRMVMDMNLGRYVEQVVDGGAAELTVLTEAPYVPCYANYVRVIAGVPPARAQIVRADTGAVLVERGRYPAPFYDGQTLAVGEQHYRITATSWPNRNPDTGSAGAAEDYQLVTVSPIPDQEPVAPLP